MLRRLIYKGILVTSKRGHYVAECFFSALYEIGELFSRRYFWPFCLRDWKWSLRNMALAIRHHRQRAKIGHLMYWRTDEPLIPFWALAMANRCYHNGHLRLMECFDGLFALYHILGSFRRLPPHIVVYDIGHLARRTIHNVWHQ